MDLSAGTAKLHFALKTLRVRWEEVKGDWKDVVRMDFEENHLKPLEQLLSATLGAMGRLDQVLAKAQKECS